MKKAIPFIFVFLWSTGFIAIKYGLQYSSTGDFLMLRTLCNIVVFAALMFFVRRKEYEKFHIGHAMVTGLLIHGAYLTGVFFAIEQGMPAGLTGIIVGFQPLLTAILAVRVLDEKLSKVQWLAILVGLAGLILVVSGGINVATVTSWGITLTLFALFGITLGTIYQKRYCQNQALLPSVFWQYVPCLFLFTFIAGTETAVDVQWTTPFILSLAWLVIALSVIAILLLLYMIENGGAAKVTAYFYLVPPLTAFEGWFLFDESLSVKTILGMLLCAFSVFMVFRKSAKVKTEDVTDVQQKLAVQTEQTNNAPVEAEIEEMPNVVKA